MYSHTCNTLHIKTILKICNSENKSIENINVKTEKKQTPCFYTKGRRRTKKQRVLHVTSKTIRVQLSTYIRIHFYQYNPLNMLARSFTARKEKNKKLLMPTMVEGTRLVAHLVQTLTNLRMSYKFIITHLEQVIT